MSGKNTAVFGIYQTRAAAEECVDVLLRAGFRNTDISALFPDNAGTKDFAHEKNTKAPEGATTGATSGAVVGGVLGWLAGIGALAIPGIGPFIAAGPIVAALAGAGAVGVAGGIVGALVGLGIPEYEAKRYEGPCETWRHSVLCSLRHTLGKTRRGSSEAHGGGGYFVIQRSTRGLRDFGPAYGAHSLVDRR